MNKTYEVNFDGIVGNTHNYSGLSLGNVASLKNKTIKAYPKKAALQGLEKMWQLKQRGFMQAVLPPQSRPHFSFLRSLGFDGSDAQVLKKAYQTNQQIFRAACSASCMWTANAATVSPASDTQDKRTHLSVANLANKLHRVIESDETYQILKKIFHDSALFEVHKALPAGEHFGDEGAANHTRLCSGNYANPGLEMFVFGRYSMPSDNQKALAPKIFPARQTFEASQAVSRRHQLRDEAVAYLQQNPAVIDQGVFHNDVIAVGNQNFLFHHQEAFLDSKKCLQNLKQQFRQVTGDELFTLEVKTREVSIDDAVKSYLFNTQLLSIDAEKMLLVAPKECEEIKSVHRYLEQLLQKNNTPIKEILTFDLRESMQNGGGPACLRLRVVLTEKQIASIQKKVRVFLDESLYLELKNWINQYYDDDFVVEDLLKQEVLLKNQEGHAALQRILMLS